MSYLGYLPIKQDYVSLTNQYYIIEITLTSLENNISSTKFAPLMKTHSNTKKKLFWHSISISFYV